MADIPLSVSCAVSNGAEGCDQVGESGRREAFFKRLPAIADDIPNRDTYGRVLAALSPPTAFTDRSATRIASAREGTGPTAVAWRSGRT